VAVPAVLVGHVPQPQGRVIFITVRKRLVERGDLAPVFGRRRAVVVALAVTHGVPVRRDAQDLRVLLRQPGGPRAGGRGQDRLHAVFGQLIHDFVQPAKRIDAVLLFQLRPGEDTHGQSIDMGELGQAHILFPDRVLIGQPLFGIVIAPVEHMGHVFDDRRILLHRIRLSSGLKPDTL